MKRVIAITYDDGCPESKYLIDRENEQYAYITSGWDGQKMRYDKVNNQLEIMKRSGEYQATTDCIIQIDIID